MLQYATVTISGEPTLIWTNKTVSSGGGVVPIAEINWLGSEVKTISPSNIGDWTVLNVTDPSFTTNNSGLWTQNETYPCVLIYNSSNAVSLKIDWFIKLSGSLVQTFEIGYAFNDGQGVTIDKIPSGVLSYSGTKLINYVGMMGATSNFFLCMRCTSASNQSITIIKLNFMVTCDRVIS